MYCICKKLDIDVDFGERPEFGTILQNWQVKVYKTSKDIYNMVMEKAIANDILSEREKKNYNDRKNISLTKLQNIVSKVDKSM